MRRHTIAFPLARPAALICALFGAACSSMNSDGRKVQTLFVTGRVTVESYTSRDEEGARLLLVSAQTIPNAPSRLTELSVTLFEDVDDDGQVGPGEQRSRWHATSSAGTARLAASGNDFLGAEQSVASAQLKLEVRVVYVSTGGAIEEERAVVPMDI